MVKTLRNSSLEKSSDLVMMWSDCILVSLVVSDDAEGISVALVGIVMGNGMMTGRLEARDVTIRDVGG